MLRGPSRWASSGIEPPPANGSRIGGGFPPQDLQISARASFSSASSWMFSHFDQALDDAVQSLPFRLLGFLGRELLGVRGRVIDQLGE